MAETGRPRPLTLVSLSGGMDSTVLLAHYADADHRLLAVSVDYGQRHVREIAAARAVAALYGAEHLVVDLRAAGALLRGSALTDPDVDVPSGHYQAATMSLTVVPNRNAILGNLLVGIGMPRGAELVALGMHAGDHAIYPDCRPEFVDALRLQVQAGNVGYSPPRVEAPFVHMTKAQIARRGATLDAPLHLTWSCYLGEDRHCGTCGTCVERREAFTSAGLADPTEYKDGAPLGAADPIPAAADGEGKRGRPPGSPGAARPAGAVNGVTAGRGAR